MNWHERLLETLDAGEADTLRRIAAEADDLRAEHDARRYAAPPKPAPVRRIVSDLPSAPPSRWKFLAPNVHEQTVTPTAKGLCIHGLATTPTITAYKCSWASEGVDAILPIPLLAAHEDGGTESVGEVFHLRRSPGGVYMRACLFDHAAAQYAADLVRDGEYGSLSVGRVKGSQVLRSRVDGVQFFAACRLKEISLTRKPANPDTCVRIWDGGDGREFWGTPTAMAAETQLRYRRAWRADTRYEAGDFVTKNGGLWHAEIPSTGCDPKRSPLCWRLVVKSGQAQELERTQ